MAYTYVTHNRKFNAKEQPKIPKAVHKSFYAQCTIHSWRFFELQQKKCSALRCKLSERQVRARAYKELVYVCKGDLPTRAKLAVFYDCRTEKSTQDKRCGVKITFLLPQPMKKQRETKSLIKKLLINGVRN